jgi:hypothetical protein
MSSNKQSFKKQLRELKDKIENLEKRVNLLNKMINEINTEKHNIRPKNNYRASSKYNKVLEVLECIKKEHEEYFTLEDYQRFLIMKFGQNDTRTIKSDIEMLELTDQITKKDKKYYLKK